MARGKIGTVAKAVKGLHEEPETIPMGYYDLLGVFYKTKAVLEAWEQYQQRPNSVKADRIRAAAVELVEHREGIKLRLEMEKGEMCIRGTQKLSRRLAECRAALSLYQVALGQSSSTDGPVGSVPPSPSRRLDKGEPVASQPHRYALHSVPGVDSPQNPPGRA